MDTFTHKTDAMRRVLMLVSRGYFRWVAGEIPAKKAEALSLKFADRYGTQKTPQMRWRAQKRGEATAQFVSYRHDKTVFWWLLVTPGNGLVEQMESLSDATSKSKRLTFTGYELAQTPRKGGPAQWTWRMTHELVEDWEERFKRAIRWSNEMDMAQALHSLARVPGFSESRRQAFGLAKFAQDEWKRSRRGDWPYPPIYVGWVGRYQTGETEPLSQKPSPAGRRT